MRISAFSLILLTLWNSHGYAQKTEFSPELHTKAFQNFVLKSAKIDQYGEPLNGSLTIKIAGDIAPGSENVFEEKIKTTPTDIVSLFSDGGDIDAAMKIGRILRARDIAAVVAPSAKCQSACVLILAGATRRHVFGSVTLHRPYFYKVPSGLSRTEIDDQFKKMIQRIRLYFQEMNIPNSLLEEMISIPPESGRDLSSRDLERFMLDGVDPASDETDVMDEAKRYRLSSADYRHRSAVARETCAKTITESRSLFDYKACNLSVILGIPGEIARQRLTKLRELQSKIDVTALCETAILVDGVSICH